MNLKLILIMVVCLQVTGNLRAQSFAGSTLTWVADRVINAEQADTVMMNCSFRTVNNSQVVWIQKGGSVNATYQVTAVQGSWPDIQSAGSVQLSLLRNGKASKIQIERSDNGILLTFDFSRPDQPVHLKFRIIDVQ